MPGILDQVAHSATTSHNNQFRPNCPDQFFALQLARKLNEPQAAQHYADLSEHHSVGQFLTAYRRTKADGSHREPARSFHDELQRLGDRENEEIRDRRLAAIRLDRRAIAVVIFSGYHLEYPPLVRQLRTDIDKAQSTAAGFIAHVMEKCPFQTAALESLPNEGDAEVQRQLLMKTIGDVLQEQAIGIWQVPRPDILAAFGHPPLRTRGQIHEVVETIWPDIIGNGGAPLVRDALALGLYCQTEYLFNL
jgi:hypothetical protein